MELITKFFKTAANDRKWGGWGLGLGEARRKLKPGKVSHLNCMCQVSRITH